MQEAVRVVLFDIKDFGYYKRGNPEPQFGSISDILSQLRIWSNNKRFGETKTYDKGTGDLLPTYFVDSVSQGNCHLLILWNESPNTEGAVASLNANTPVGQAEVTMNQLGQDEIPGHATYFFFMTDVNVVATIRFQHAASGKAQLRKYLYSFMRYFSAHAVTKFDDEDGSLSVSGYRASSKDTIVQVRPRFNLEIHRRDSHRQYLIDNASRVRKVLKKANLELTQRDQRALWQRLLEAVHLHEPSVRPHIVRLDYSMEVDELDPVDMRRLIDAWSGEEDLNDYGFKLSGENDLYWLGKTVAKDDFTLDIDRINSEIVDPKTLLSALYRKRQVFVDLMR